MSIPYGRYLFKNLGRGQNTLSALIRDEKDFWKKISPFFMSKELSYSYDTEANIGHIFAGPVRCVGTFQMQCLGSTCGKCDKCFERAKELVSAKKKTAFCEIGTPSDKIKFQKAIMLCQERLGFKGFQDFIKGGA